MSITVNPAAHVAPIARDAFEAEAATLSDDAATMADALGFLARGILASPEARAAAQGSEDDLAEFLSTSMGEYLDNAEARSEAEWARLRDEVSYITQCGGDLLAIFGGVGVLHARLVEAHAAQVA